MGLSSKNSRAVWRMVYRRLSFSSSSRDWRSICFSMATASGSKPSGPMQGWNATPRASSV